MTPLVRPLAPHEPAPAPPVDPKVAELAQRGRIVLDVCAADLEAAEEALGPFHETSVHFRAQVEKSRRAWERLRATWGSKALAQALEAPPATVFSLGRDRDDWPEIVLIVIGGQTYRVERLDGTPEAPAIRRLTRLPANEDGPYYACKLADGTLQCDCGQWAYELADTTPDALCKHLAALRHLKWL